MLDNHHRKVSDVKETSTRVLSKWYCVKKKNTYFLLQSMFIRTDSRSGSGESFCHANVMKVDEIACQFAKFQCHL